MDNKYDALLQAAPPESSSGSKYDALLTPDSRYDQLLVDSPPEPSSTQESDKAASEPILQQIGDFIKKPSPSWMQPAEQFLQHPLVPAGAIAQAFRESPAGIPFALAERLAPESVAKPVTGLIEGGAETLSGFTSPANVGLLALTPEGLVGKAIAAGFTIDGLRQYPELYRQWQATTDPEERAKIFAKGAALAIPALSLLPKARGGEVDANGARTSTDTGSETTPPEVEQGAEGPVRVRDTSQDGMEAGTGEVAGTESYARYQPPAEVAPGFVRLYHGGNAEQAGSDFTPSRDYAQGYADKSDGKVWSVDVPADSPFLKTDEYTGEPFIRQVLPNEIADQAKPLEGAGSPPPVSTAPPSTPKPAGIAQRIYDERGLGVQPGKGTSPENLIARGSTITADQAEARIRQTKAVGIDDILALRAREFEFQKATNAAKDALDARPRDPAAKAAYDAALAQEKAYAENVVKPAQNIWAGAGHAQQGAVDVDTGTFTGIQRAVNTLHKRALTPEEAHVGRAAAENVQRATRAEAKALQNAATLVAKKVRPKGKARRTLEQLREDLANKTKEITC